MIEGWAVDGTDLASLAWGVHAMTEGRGLPPARGGNLVIPFRHGARSFAKYYGERRLTLMMYVLGQDPITGLIDASSLEDLYVNLATLRKLFGKRSSLLSIVHTQPDGTTRTAQAEVIGTLDFDNVHAGGLAQFAVELVLPDPFWYGVEGTQTKDPWDASGQTLAVTHLGNFDTVKMVITITGACQNPRLTNDDASYVEVLVTNVGGDILVIDTDAFTAEKNAANVIGSLLHQGDPAFFKLRSGANIVTLTSDAVPSAIVDFTFSPNYL